MVKLEAGAAGLEVVGAQVAGDGHQPGAEVLALPAEAGHVAQGPEEGLGGEVLGQAARVGAPVDEPVDRRVVVVVELAERLGVAVAGQSTRAISRWRSDSLCSDDAARSESS